MLLSPRLLMVQKSKAFPPSAVVTFLPPWPVSGSIKVSKKGCCSLLPGGNAALLWLLWLLWLLPPSWSCFFRLFWFWPTPCCKPRKKRRQKIIYLVLFQEQSDLFMDKWEYQNKPCYLENRVVREPCKRKTDFWSWPK